MNPINLKWYYWVFFPIESYHLSHFNSFIILLKNELDNGKILKFHIKNKNESLYLKIISTTNVFIIKYNKDLSLFNYILNDDKIVIKRFFKIAFTITSEFLTYFKNSKIYNEYKSLFKAHFFTKENYYGEFRIISDDFKRNTPADTYFTKNYKDLLLKASNNKCLFCSSKKELELDHFFIPKSHGGNFILKTYNGILINNCFILCSTCNKSKNDRSFKLLFPINPINIKKIANIQEKMNQILNNCYFD